MRISSRLLISIIIFAVAFAGILYSNHGLLELRAFEKVVSRTQIAVGHVEEENKKLRRQLDLLEDPNSAISERQAREIMGWVKSGELVFREVLVRR